MSKQIQINLEEKLKSLRLLHTAGHLSDFIAAATTQRLSCHQILEELCHREMHELEQRRIERRVKESKVGTFKTLADFDWTWPRKIDREAVQEAMRLNFIKEKANVILVGPQGVGKTLIARNIAHAAALQGMAVYYTTAAALVVDLASQDSARTLSMRIAKYSRWDLLVVDEVGYLSFDAKAADLLFAVVNQRYENGSIVLTTNLAFTDWGTIFPGAACVTAMIDRLTHHAEIIAIDSDSYRRRESILNNEQQQAKRKPRKN